MMQIQGGMPPMGMSGGGAQSLTDTQKQSLEEVLSKYDSENLSDDDAKALVEQIKELEIQPGRGLAEALAGAGIDARGLAEQAGIGNSGRPDGASGPGGPGGSAGPSGAQGGKGPDSAAVQTLQAVVEQLRETATEDGEDFSTRLTQALEAAGLDTSSPILDYRI